MVEYNIDMYIFFNEISCSKSSALPAEPNQIKCKCQGPAVVQIGEGLEAEIQITVKDKFGNEITDVSTKLLSEW